MIKNIIFDFGDVFINLDKETFSKELNSLAGSKLPDNMLASCVQYEIGKITTDVFVKRFVDRFFLQIKGDFKHEKENEFIKKWNSILLDFPIHRFVFLQELAKSKNYRLFLLSNTNELHINWIKNNWGLDVYNEFASCFEQFYLSHEIHLRKPNKDIYRFVLQKNNLIPEETLFIDDTKENTDTAEQLGIKIWNIEPSKEDVTELLQKPFFR